MKVLVAEDDALTRDALRTILEGEGFAVECASNGLEASARFDAWRPDVVLLDIMMPERNGYDVLREIRRVDQRVAALFVSAKSEEVDKVVGLELGADDYIVKPFGVQEVLARVRAAIRRLPQSEKGGATPFEMGDLRVVPTELRAYRGDQAIDLGPREVTILQTLWERAGQVVDRDTLFDRCWGYDYFPQSRTLDQTISQLRKRIERDPSSPGIVKTVRGVGYRYEPES